MDNDIDLLQIKLAPESLADLVENLTSKGFNEQQVFEEVERIKQGLLADIRARIASDDDFLLELDDAPVQYLH